MTTLATAHSHPRDNYIQFYEKTHLYIITTDRHSEYTSVTTWCHSHFEKFNADKVIKKIMSGPGWNETNKYWNMSPADISDKWRQEGQRASAAGTKLHNQIECFMNASDMLPNYSHDHLRIKYCESHNMELEQDESSSTPKEWNHFIRFICDHPSLVPYRTEWMIYSEDLKIAGSIDMVYLNDDDTLSIYDWKRCAKIDQQTQWNKYAKTNIISHIPDTNYWHYALQLNTYKYILETKYDKVVRDLTLVRLHPDTDTYELIPLPILTGEMEKLMDQRRRHIRDMNAEMDNCV